MTTYILEIPMGTKFKEDLSPRATMLLF